MLNEHKILFKYLNTSQKIFRSNKHKVYTVQVDKVASSFNDDNCFTLDNNIDTYTHGHHKIKSML